MKTSFNTSKHVKTLAVVLGLGLFAGTVTPSFAYTKSSMAIGAQSELILATKASLQDRLSIVLDSRPLGDVAKIFSERLGLPVYAENASFLTPISVFSEDNTLAELLQKVSAASDTFLVYRDGFLIFASKAQVNLKLNREFSKDELASLAQKLHGLDPIIDIQRTQLSAKVNRSEFIILREALINARIHAELISSDQVIDQLNFI